MLAVLGLLITATATAQDNCRPPEFVLNEVSEYVDNFSAADALDALAGLEDSYACSDRADPGVLGELWLAQGMANVYSGDIEAARVPFAAASRAAPGLWPEKYGNPALYEESAAAEAPMGGLRMVPAPTGIWVAVDGVAVHPPIEVPAGAHLVQLGYPDEPAKFARFVMVPAGGEQQVKHGLRPPVAEVELVTGPTVVPGVGEGGEPAVIAPQALPKYINPKTGLSKKPRRTAAAVGFGITGAVLFGGAAGTRLYYDAKDREYAEMGQEWNETSDHTRLAVSIDAMHVSSMIFGGLSLIKLSKATGTPSDAAIAAESGAQ